MWFDPHAKGAFLRSAAGVKGSLWLPGLTLDAGPGCTMGRATRKGAAGLWAGCCPLGPFRRPPIAPSGGPPSPRWAGRPSRAAFKLPRRSAGRPAGRTAPAPGSARSARGTGRLRPNGPPAGGAKPGGPFGPEGAQHGHHPTGPLCAPEHIRGERPGRSRAGEKARPRSARRAWPCLFDGRRKRPHRCPAGACGSIKRGRGVAWPPNRRRKASGCGGGHDRRSRAGSAPHGGPRYLFFTFRAQPPISEGGRGFRGRGAPPAQGAPSWTQLSGSRGKRKEQRSALAVRCSFLDSADNDVHPVGPLSVYHDSTALSTLTLVRVFRRTGLASGRRCSPQRAAPAPTGAGGGWGLFAFRLMDLCCL